MVGRGYRDIIEGGGLCDCYRMKAVLSRSEAGRVVERGLASLAVE